MFRCHGFKKGALYSIVCACYRSLKFCEITDFLSSLTSATERMDESRQEILLIGDFNIDMLVREHGDDPENNSLTFAKGFVCKTK